nr:MAG TPA: hypothetical protein [Caudoviricetes sp.]
MLSQSTVSVPRVQIPLSPPYNTDLLSISGTQKIILTGFDRVESQPKY